MRLAAVLVPLVLFGLAACSTDAGRGSADDSFTLPSGGKGGGAGVPPSSRTIRGVLTFDDIEGGCAFLEAADGSRYEVIYPDGWVLDRAAARLRGPDGEDLAAGSTIEIAGSIATDRSSICQVGPIVVATSVTVATS